MDSEKLSVHDLLVEYQKAKARLNRESNARLGIEDNLYKQVVAPPEPLSPKGVATLVPGRYQPLTPMLKARFEYAASWTRADGGLEWLSLAQMEAAATDPPMIELVQIRLDTWEDSPLHQFPFDRLSIFGAYIDQCEVACLLWPSEAGQEPAVVSYAGNYEVVYKDFRDYLLRPLKEISEALQSSPPAAPSK